MNEQRRRIKQIDELLVEILEERAEVGKEIAQIKRDRNLPIEDAAQEKKVIERAQKKTDLDVSGVFREIIEMTKTEME